MFTGLVEEIGTVASVRRNGAHQVLEIEAGRVLEDSAVGDSIAVNGVCQTVTALDGGRFSVDTLSASLEKTTLGTLRSGNRVNLERALRASARLGGHIVQGHVDATGRVGAVREGGSNVFLTVEVPHDLLRYCIREGSIAVDGVSLTIADLHASSVTINVIPVTWRDTVLSDRRPGDVVNLEVDVLARYVERLMTAPQPLSEERLREMGY